jgi:hypothetical protein
MGVSFNELEQRLLSFLKQEFLEKGSKPYRDVMARLEHDGIVRAISVGAPTGRLQIDPVVVEVVRQLDEQAAQPKPKPNRMEQAKQYSLGKWWIVLAALALVALTAVAKVASSLKTILEWFGFRP